MNGGKQKIQFVVGMGKSLKRKKGEREETNVCIQNINRYGE